jgi:predicted RNA-binding protein with PUA-like domain
MSYWLLKTEPSTYSFADLVKAKETRWDGIENPAALKLMKSAVAGDRCLVYHTGDEKSAIGECEIIKPAYPDPKNARLVVIDVRAGKPLKKPISLAIIKRDKLFADSPLVRQGRLSFVPLTDAQWKRIHELASL